MANDFLNETFEAAPSDCFPKAPASGWEVTPSMTREQHENAQRISADFDAAWVSIPASSFFPEEQDQAIELFSQEQLSIPASSYFPEEQDQATELFGQDQWAQPTTEARSKRYHSRGSGPVDLDESFDATTVSQKSQPILPSWKNDDVLNTSGELGAIEVSLLDEGNHLDASEDRSAGQSASAGGSIENDTKSIPKRRGFLRTFMRKELRKEKKRASANPNQSASPASVGVQSMPASSRPQPIIPLLPLPPGFDPNQELPPGFDPNQEMAPPRNCRGESRSLNRRPPPRTRSASLERFRSASMAKKFSRVMRLYDHE
jgi:hypothetical protein